MLKGFRDFLLRGNVLDLAIGIVVGGAFTAVVTGLTDGLLSPLIALIFGQPDLTGIHFALRGTDFPIGQFLHALLNFVLVATALYFVVVVPVKKLQAKLAKPAPDAGPEEPTPDVALLTEIRDLLANRA